MKILAITGEIAVGKNQIAEIFAEKFGAKIFDADHAYHQLLLEDQEVISNLKSIFPAAFYSKNSSVKNSPVFEPQNSTSKSPISKSEFGFIDRQILASEIFKNPEKLKLIEALIHPRIRAACDEFIAQNQRLNQQLLILNIPLLNDFYRYDFLLRIVASKEQQKLRYLSRSLFAELEGDFLKILQEAKQENQKKESVASIDFIGSDKENRELQPIKKRDEAKEITQESNKIRDSSQKIAAEITVQILKTMLEEVASEINQRFCFRPRIKTIEKLHTGQNKLLGAFELINNPPYLEEENSTGNLAKNSAESSIFDELANQIYFRICLAKQQICLKPHQSQSKAIQNKIVNFLKSAATTQKIKDLTKKFEKIAEISKRAKRVF